MKRNNKTESLAALKNKKAKIFSSNFELNELVSDEKQKIEFLTHRRAWCIEQAARVCDNGESPDVLISMAEKIREYIWPEY